MDAERLAARASAFAREAHPKAPQYHTSIAVAYIHGAMDERARIAAIVRDFHALNDAEDGPRYPGLAEWEGGDDGGRWVIVPERLVELIEGRP